VNKDLNYLHLEKSVTFEEAYEWVKAGKSYCNQDGTLEIIRSLERKYDPFGAKISEIAHRRIATRDEVIWHVQKYAAQGFGMVEALEMADREYGGSL
jgi:hypothetical protein